MADLWSIAFGLRFGFLRVTRPSKAPIPFYCDRPPPRVKSHWVMAMLAVVLCANPFSPSHAGNRGEEPVERRPWTFSFYFENDLFADTDQHYTNGLKLSWVSPDVSEYTQIDALPDWAHAFARRLPFFPEYDGQTERNVVLSVGQNIYTPQDIDRAGLIENDRPYAGWLYFGLGFQSRNDRQLDELELQIGMVGPLSLAEETQSFVHELRDLNRPRGWNNQLRNEPGVAAVYQRRWRHAKPNMSDQLGIDAITHVGGAVGNVAIFAEAGAMVRFGWNLPKDFGTSRIRPGGDAGAPIGGRSPKRRKFGIHGFIGIDGQYV
ncbi:MAG: lipid A deacylase LpxR family protein, partial [Pseudomonadota bacterium]